MSEQAESSCFWEGCESLATTTAGIVFGPYRIGPLEVQLCDRHTRELRERIPDAPEVIDARVIQPSRSP